MAKQISKMSWNEAHSLVLDVDQKLSRRLEALKRIDEICGWGGGTYTMDDLTEFVGEAKKEGIVF